MERMKMPRTKRAAQFAPFDALKGLHDALKLKEYEHNRKEKGGLSEEKILEISKILKEIKKEDVVKVEYFEDGYNLKISGRAKISYFEQYLQVDKKLIKFEDIIDLAIVK